MRIKSIIITMIIFAVLCSMPILGSLEVTKINKRPQRVYEQEIQIIELREVSSPVEVNLLYRQ